MKSITTNTTCLGIMIDNTLTWESQLEMVIPKLSVVCLAVTAVTHFVGLDILKTVYRFYLHSVINYGIIFGVNSSYNNGIFKLQKIIIRTVMAVAIRDLCT
jgi:hypothetical protein